MAEGQRPLPTGGVTEKELERGLSRPEGMPEAPHVTRERAVTRLCNAVADVLEDARPLVKLAMDELEKQLEEERQREGR